VAPTSGLRRSKASAAIQSGQGVLSVEKGETRWDASSSAALVIEAMISKRSSPEMQSVRRWAGNGASAGRLRPW